MFEFFGSTLFWIYIMFMFILQLITGIGIYGRGNSRDKLTTYSTLATIILVIFIWIYIGFIAFLASIIFWFLLTYISTPIIITFLRKMGVRPRNPNEF